MSASILNQLRKQKNQKTLEQTSSEIINALPKTPALNENVDLDMELELPNSYQETITKDSNLYKEIEENTEKNDNQYINYYKKPELPSLSSPIVNFHKDNLKSSLEYEYEKEIDPSVTSAAKSTTHSEYDIEDAFNVSMVKRHLQKRSKILESLMLSQTKYYKRENIITSVLLGVSFFFAMGVTTIGLFSLWPAFAVAFMTWKIRDEETSFNIKKDIFKVNIYEKLFSRRHVNNKIYQISKLDQSRSETFQHLFETIEQEIKNQAKIITNIYSSPITNKLNEIKDEIKNFNLFEDNPEKSKEIFDSLCIKIIELDNLKKQQNSKILNDLDFNNKSV